VLCSLLLNEDFSLFLTLYWSVINVRHALSRECVFNIALKISFVKVFFEKNHKNVSAYIFI